MPQKLNTADEFVDPKLTTREKECHMHCKHDNKQRNNETAIKISTFSLKIPVKNKKKGKLLF